MRHIFSSAQAGRRLAFLLMASVFAFGAAQPAFALTTQTHGHHKHTSKVRASHHSHLYHGAYRHSGSSSSPVFDSRYAALVIDAKTGAVLEDVNSNALRHPASLTKMMTLYVTFKALDEGRLNLDDRLPVSEHAAEQSPTKLNLRPGQTISVRDAILGMVTESANDAAVVLAEAQGGTEYDFAREMTRQAHLLGMSSTNYVNASGLPDDRQVTTAHDYARLAQALIYQSPRYYPFFSTADFRYNGIDHHNHNHLMERYAGMDGIKTGFIRASGFNLTASAVRDGHRLIAVVFGGKSAYSRDERVASLLDTGFSEEREADAEQAALQAQSVRTAAVAQVQNAAMAPSSMTQLVRMQNTQSQ